MGGLVQPSAPLRAYRQYPSRRSRGALLCPNRRSGDGSLTQTNSSPGNPGRFRAHFVRHLVDGHYREADRIVLVMDQLNTHSPASLYEAFAPEEAKRLADRLEIHHTPKHGSWLNMAEIELSALGRDLPDRVGDRAMLERHVQAWQHRRNAAATRAEWQFTTKDARIKLRKLYPTMDESQSTRTSPLRSRTSSR